MDGVDGVARGGGDGGVEEFGELIPIGRGGIENRDGAFAHLAENLGEFVVGIGANGVRERGDDVDGGLEIGEAREFSAA